MFRRNDKNSIPILRMITHECIGIEQIVHLWFLVKSSQLFYDKTLFNLVTLPSSMSGLHRNGNVAANVNSNTNAQTLPVHQACACLMDEIVMAWRLACLNPASHGIEGEVEAYREQLLTWQTAIFESIRKYCTNILNNASNLNRSSPNTSAAVPTWSSTSRRAKPRQSIHTANRIRYSAWRSGVSLTLSTQRW